MASARAWASPGGVTTPQPSTSAWSPVPGTVVAASGRPEASMLVSLEGRTRSAAASNLGQQVQVGQGQHRAHLLRWLQVMQLDIGEALASRSSSARFGPSPQITKAMSPR